jgi:type I restriction enzyme, S subunit
VGDILFNRTNSPELVGKAAVYDADLPAVFASYLIRLRCDDQLVQSRYVCWWINSPWGRWWARTVRTDGVSQSNINATTLQAMPLPLPPVEEQAEIVRRVEALFKLADAIEKRLAAATAQAEKLTQAILAKAFRGELVPTEAELARREGRPYEPASTLLERIRTERSWPDSESGDQILRKSKPERKRWLKRAGKKKSGYS